MMMLTLAMLATAAASPDAAPTDAAPADAAHSPANMLAARVVAAAGNPYDLAQLDFTFVVQAEGKERSRRSHRWCPQRGIVQVTGPDGVARISAVDGSPLGDTTAAQAESAWGAFINDSYWLLAPSKVFDGGVTRSLDDQGRLVLTFQGVGLTPGDRYALTVDPTSGAVTRWDFVLQTGREGGFAWSPYEKVGSLGLSLTRTADEGGAVIGFEGVAAGQACALD